MAPGECINIKRLNSVNGKIYVIQVGVLSVQINTEKAEFLCRMLANWLGFELIEKDKYEILKRKASRKIG